MLRRLDIQLCRCLIQTSSSLNAFYLLSGLRLYSDQEISAILKRAGELQATGSDAETHGLSLEELQAIAAEVGLDPKLVAAAAAELQHAGVDKKRSSLLGAPLSIYLERVIPGEVSEARWSEVAEKVGEAFDMVGRSGQVGDALEWTHTGERVHLQVTVRPHGGQTKVRVVGKFFRIALLHYLLALIIGGFWGTIVPLSMQIAPGISFAIGLMLFVVGFFFARYGYSRFVWKKKQATEKLAGMLQELIGEPSETTEIERTKPLLDDVELKVSEEEPPHQDSSRGRVH